MEILESIKEVPITIYHIGNEWWDLCGGPHVESTGNIDRKAVELESVASAYWRGDTNKLMLQRIYGTAWEDEKQLKAYIHFKEEAKRRDHRRLAPDLDLFSIQMETHASVKYLQDEAGGGLVFWHPKGAIVRQIIEDAWKKIHMEHDDRTKDEIRGVLDLTEEILLQFGFSKYEVNLLTRPEKAVGGDDIWEKATSALKDALADKGWSIRLMKGPAPFMVDFNLPECFVIAYIDSNSEKKRPIMIHRAVLGSLERFFGVLIEHYAGDFPLWLCPTQARVLPVTDSQLQYCNELTRKLKASGIGAEVRKLIRNAEKQKIPLMAAVGLKEVETQTVAVRSRFGGELGTMTIDDFVSRIRYATENRTSF
ncbi:hypothetical protein ACSBR1_028352 [Camellia fascicularis]